MSILRAERAVKALRELDADPEHMAQVLRVRAKRMRSWLSQETVPTGIHLDQLEWLADQFRREKAVKESDLPVCEWIEAWTPPDPSKGMREFHAALKEFQEHPTSCRVCQARTAFADAQFGRSGPMPHAPAGPARVQRILEVLANLPRLIAWPLVGATGLVIMVGAASLIRIVVRTLSGQPIPPLSVVDVTQFIGLLAFLGASGGVSAALVRPLVRRMDDDREYVIGIAGAFGYLTAMVWVLPRLDPDALGDMSLSDGVTWVIIGVLSVASGIAGTKGWRSAGRD